ncbi:MAG: hypothetical protein IKJ44_00840 [Elusimicrobiaceae bacterium]|nr:hypothetical protein [Elusimicrobiaceae bacterium]
MGRTLVEAALAAGAVACIAALAARLAVAKERLKQKNKDLKAYEKVDKAIDDANSLDRDECLNRLRGGSGK